MTDWKEGLTRKELNDTMLELFYRDLDSWFNTGIFYCDSCFDDFIIRWPGVY